MKFDAVVGNPPYQEMDGGAQASASPLYHHFVGTAKKLNPTFISFIMPTRWYVGGKGLDSFRNEMLNDVHLKELYDYLTPEDIFPNTNIRGGVCYFLWDENYDNSNDFTRVVTYENNKIIADVVRPMKIDGTDIFIRDGKAVNILRKIFSNSDIPVISHHISVRKPFGLESNFIKTTDFHETTEGLKDPIKCYGRAKTVGYLERDIIKTRSEWIDLWKVFLPYANNIGTELNDDNQNTFIGEPQSICTETFLVAGADLGLNKKSSKNLSHYLRSKFARFLLSLAKNSQHATSKAYCFVPSQDFTDESDIDWNNSIPEIDKQLYKKYRLNQGEINYIENKIKEM